MTPEQLQHWRNAMGYRRTDAANALGMSYRAYRYMETGERGGKTVGIDLRTALACSALYHRIAPYGE